MLFRSLERARLLLHVIDASEGDADERWHAIDGELGAYGAGLEARSQAVVLNKIDLVPEPPFAVADDRIVRVFRVSCATGAGIEQLKRALFELCPPGPVATAADEDGLVDFLVYRPRPTGRRFRVLRTDRGYRIAGESPDDPQELEAALRAAGIRAGDEVEVAGDIREWQ